MISKCGVNMCPPETREKGASGAQHQLVGGTKTSGFPHLLPMFSLDDSFELQTTQSELLWTHVSNSCIPYMYDLISSDQEICILFITWSIVRGLLSLGCEPLAQTRECFHCHRPAATLSGSQLLLLWSAHNTAELMASWQLLISDIRKAVFLCSCSCCQAGQETPMKTSQLE